MTIRGVRGATTIKVDTKEEVLSATHELLNALLEANPDLHADEIASTLFTTTGDIISAFPALAARQLGWDLVPMMCAREIPVPDSLPMCILSTGTRTRNRLKSSMEIYVRRFDYELIWSSKVKGEKLP